ncbi:MAG: Rieske (2Fe-2S) protein [Cytophagales bacterium]|nr:MAG: Rieske (2Fe-2S) protein [Cytophagales bacterium]
MNRKDFLKQIGFSGAAIFATYCTGGLAACSSSANNQNSVVSTPDGAVVTPVKNGTDFTLDLGAAENVALTKQGGFLVRNGVVIAFTTQGTYAAVTQICSHEGRAQVIYQSSQNNFYCSAHGALFDTKGIGLNKDGKNGLKVYNTTLTNNLLRIYS